MKNEGLMNIGGNNNQFINWQVENTRDEGRTVYNKDGNIIGNLYTFRQAINEKTTTPWDYY